MGEMRGWDRVRRTRAWVGLGLYTPSFFDIVGAASGRHDAAGAGTAL